MVQSIIDRKILTEFPLSSIEIRDEFWTPRLQRNQEVYCLEDLDNP